MYKIQYGRNRHQIHIGKNIHLIFYLIIHSTSRKYNFYRKQHACTILSVGTESVQVSGREHSSRDIHSLTHTHTAAHHPHAVRTTEISRTVSVFVCKILPLASIRGNDDALAHATHVFPHMHLASFCCCRCCVVRHEFLGRIAHTWTRSAAGGAHTHWRVGSSRMMWRFAVGRPLILLLDSIDVVYACVGLCSCYMVALERSVRMCMLVK